jgi:hypothetical protein
MNNKTRRAEAYTTRHGALLVAAARHLKYLNNVVHNQYSHDHVNGTYDNDIELGVGYAKCQYIPQPHPCALIAS